MPAAMMAGILAGILDILSILGFFIAAAPSFLLAMSVSPKTAFIVLMMCLLFHLLEAYLIVPKACGKLTGV